MKNKNLLQLLQDAQTRAEQQLLDSTIQATRGEIYDTSSCWPRPSLARIFSSAPADFPLLLWALL